MRMEASRWISTGRGGGTNVLDAASSSARGTSRRGPPRPAADARWWRSSQKRGASHRRLPARGASAAPLPMYCPVPRRRAAALQDAAQTARSSGRLKDQTVHAFLHLCDKTPGGADVWAASRRIIPHPPNAQSRECATRTPQLRRQAPLVRGAPPPGRPATLAPTCRRGACKPPPPPPPVFHGDLG